MSTTAIAALASATIIRPDAPTLSPALDGAVRSACDGAWSAVEIVFAGEALRARLAETDDAHVIARTPAVLSMFGESVTPRREALIELRAARREGALDAKLDLTGLVASCGRAGDAPAVQAGRRRVRTIAIEALPRTLASYRALSLALRESAISAFLVDAARANFRHATRGDRDLARWAVAPTGSTTRELALTACAELVGSPPARAVLDKLISGELGEVLPPPAAIVDQAGPTELPTELPTVEPPAVAEAAAVTPLSPGGPAAAIVGSVATQPTPERELSREIERGAPQQALAPAPMVPEPAPSRSIDRGAPPQALAPAPMVPETEPTAPDDPASVSAPSAARSVVPAQGAARSVVSAPSAAHPVDPGTSSPRAHTEVRPAAAAIAAVGSAASPAPRASSWIARSLLVLVFAVAALIYLIR